MMKQNHKTNVGVALLGDPKKINNGITLISLVITIILLIILAGVTINLALGENGLFNKAKYAKDEYLNAQEKEQEDINELYSEMMIATNDSAQITISVEDLKTIIQEEVQKELNENRDIFIDFDNKLTTITTQGASWTATEDCAVVSKIKVYTAVSTGVYVDGNLVHGFANGVETGAYGSSSTVVFYVKKGSVITTDPPEHNGQFALSIYGLK